MKITTEQGDETFDGEAYIQENPARLAIITADTIIYVPWERLIAFATERVEESAEAGN